MRRRLGRICVFLLLGAIVNVAVAWGAYRLADVHFWKDAEFPEHRWCRLAPFDDTNEKCIFQFSDEQGVTRWVGRGRLYGMSADIGQSGWPMRALEGGQWTRTKQSRVVAWHYESAWPMQFGIVYRFLPLRPIWPGFAINTVFYAVVLWLLFAGPFVLRRRWRIRRGLCPKCAYDLRGSKDTEKCPECGTIVAS